MSDTTKTPTIEHAADEWANSTERVLVFTIVTDGVAKEYTMPARPNGGFALKYLKLARRQGAEFALSWLLETAIGAEAYDDLSDEPDLTQDDLKTIAERVQKIALGGLESPKGS